MKNWKKGTMITLFIICSWIVIFIIDYTQVKRNHAPVFCITEKVYRDGGTVEYLCLGYKVISYNKLNGYHKSHIGFLNLKYDETLKEEQKEETRYLNALEEEPLEFSYRDAITKDYYVLIEEISYNEYILKEFKENITKQKKDEIRLMKTNTEGQPILISLSYENELFIVKIDSKRDELASQKMIRKEYSAKTYSLDISVENGISLMAKNGKRISISDYQPKERKEKNFQIQYKNTNELQTIYTREEKDEKSFNIYAYGDLWINIEKKSYTLKEALLNKKITIDQIISSIEKDEEENQIVSFLSQEGQSKYYIYEDYAIIIKNQEKEIYFGLPNLIVK